MQTDSFIIVRLKCAQYCPFYMHITSIVVLLVYMNKVIYFNIYGHIATVPAYSTGNLTNMLLQRNAKPQTQDMTPHPVTVYSHGADLSLMWNVTLEHTITHFYTPVERRDVLWNGPVRLSGRLSVRPSHVRPFTIACERDILKTACQIDFTF